METLEQWLVKELTKRNATITTAESVSYTHLTLPTIEPV